MLKTNKLLRIVAKHHSVISSTKASACCCCRKAAFPLHHHHSLPSSGLQYGHAGFESLSYIKPLVQALIQSWSLATRFYCNSPLPPPTPRLSRPRGSLWRSRKGLSREAQQVVRDLRRYKADRGRVGLIFRTSVARLLKIDILAAMKELQRENEPKLALQMFNVIRKEYWYKPDIFLYKDMMNSLAVNKQVQEVEKLFADLKVEGLQPELNVYTELLRAYLHADMPSRVSETVEEMKLAGHPPDELAHRLLWKHLTRFGHRELAIRLRHEYNKAFEAPSEEEANL